MKNKNDSPKEPPKQVTKSIQQDLFSSFLANDDTDISNTIELWECIPKYFFTANQIKKLRTPTGHADPYEHSYKIKDRNGNNLFYKVEIQPALIKQEDGSYRAFFPSKTEETIEEVLKKIMTDQQCGFHVPEKMETWVRFSYGMLRKELYRMKSGLRFDQIKHALEVMSKCILTVSESGEEIFTGAILQDYVTVNRQKYLVNSQALHVARLPFFVSHAINTLQYRQYNYGRFMECKEQLTRYLYKRLVNRFTYASHTSDHHFMFSDIKQASKLLQQSKDLDNRKKLISAMEELKERGVIMSYKTEEKKEGRKIVDIKYIVFADPQFITEQKAANKRANLAEIEAKKKGLIVDKSIPK